MEPSAVDEVDEKLNSPWCNKDIEDDSESQGLHSIGSRSIAECLEDVHAGSTPESEADSLLQDGQRRSIALRRSLAGSPDLDKSSDNRATLQGSHAITDTNSHLQGSAMPISSSPGEDAAFAEHRTTNMHFPNSHPHPMESGAQSCTPGTEHLASERIGSIECTNPLIPRLFKDLAVVYTKLGLNLVPGPGALPDPLSLPSGAAEAGPQVEQTRREIAGLESGGGVLERARKFGETLWSPSVKRTKSRLASAGDSNATLEVHRPGGRRDSLLGKVIAQRNWSAGDI